MVGTLLPTTTALKSALSPPFKFVYNRFLGYFPIIDTMPKIDMAILQVGSAIGIKIDKVWSFMKLFLIVLGIIVIALFTGTWVFGGLEWFFGFMESCCGYMEKFFNLFGWNKGIL